MKLARLYKIGKNEAKACKVSRLQGYSHKVAILFDFSVFVAMEKIAKKNNTTKVGSRVRPAMLVALKMERKLFDFFSFFAFIVFSFGEEPSVFFLFLLFYVLG